MIRRAFLVAALFLTWLPASAQSQVPLHRRIDALIRAGAKGQPFSSSADDAEFLRRVTLDLAGRIPTVTETRQYLADKSPDRRAKVVDRLLAAPSYPVHMAERFHAMFMERLGDHPDWLTYLQRSFAANKPWDQMSREILGAGAQGDTTGAAFFLAKRLENYGQNPVDYSALAGDVGRLFLGRDLRCAECHDHIFIKDYKQADFQGLLAFVKNVSLAPGKTPSVNEQLTKAKLEFASVFGGAKMQTGPRVPGRSEVAIPTFAKGEEFAIKPDRKTKQPGVLKFSTLARLAEQVPAKDNQPFNRNAVNRLWAQMMGRGLVHPLDLDHAGNPPSHPELLDLLSREFVAHKYDVKWLLRELALTETYQRSGRLPPGVKEVEPASYRTALERRLEPEQLLRSMLTATGEDTVKGGATFDKTRSAFVKAFAHAPRKPEDGFNPTLQAALFLLNDKLVLGWLPAKPGNLLDRVQKMSDDRKAIEELYLAVLSRRPSADEVQDAQRFLAARSSRRPAALRNLAWALLASTEFCVNH